MRDKINKHFTSLGITNALYLLITVIIFLSFNSLSAQDPCGLKQVMESMYAQNLNFQQQTTSSNDNDGSCTGSYEIPLVFHVLHDNGPENVSDAQILEAVEQLNNQFSGGEGGYNTNISFYIANVDPNGYCTNGINRIHTSTPGITVLDFDSDVAMKNLSRWPANDYLNVWVVSYIGIGGGISGYSYLPPAPSSVDGVVVHNMYLGTTGTANGNFTNTLSHEIGHFLNLYHVWGEDWFINGQDPCDNCHDIDDCTTLGDRVCDTEPCCGQLIHPCNIPFFDICGPDNCDCKPPNPTSIYPKENYMSYNFTCQDRFTEGQANRMCKAISMYRPRLSKSKKDGCNNGCTTLINSNTTFNNSESLSYSGDIRIQTGATLTVSGTTLHFAQGKSIFIEDGGKLVLLNNATLNKCPQATFWNGVNVEKGGELSANQANIYNAKIGVRANDDAKIDLDIVNIIGLNNTFGEGIHLTNGVEATKLNQLKIENYHTGILASSGNETYEVTNGEINNINYGLTIIENTLLLSGTIISNANNGLFLYHSIGSSISGNQIGYFYTGFQSYISPFTSITYNTIGWPNQRGKTGIYLSLSGGSVITNNTQIQSSEYGVRLFYSVSLVGHNIIDIFGQNNFAGGGIQVVTSNESQIFQNFLDVDHSSFGIETINTTGTSINNNQIDHFSTVSSRTAAIRSMGCLDEVVEENVITGVANTTGIIAQNSVGNHYECNLTNNTAEGLGVYYNSEEQDIKGNEFNAWIDLAIRSAVGLQPHHGNKFLGGSVRANELTSNERLNSQFKANQNNPELWPPDIQPNDGTWWIGEPNLNPYTCDGSYGPSWVPFGGDPDRLCAYWNYLKSIKTSKPELFFIKLYHLLKYSKTKTGYNLPNCIKLDPVFELVCGLTKLVDVSIALEKIGKVNTNNSNLSSLQTQYVQQTTDAGRIAIKGQIKNELLNLTSILNADRIQDSVRLDSINNVLNTINCAEVIIAKWKEIFKIYIKFLKQGEVAQNDRSALLSYSTECSDLYGDAIHIARAMANTFDNTYFDAYDGCLEIGSGPRSKNESTNLSTIEVYPNPTTGKVYLQLPRQYSGVASVFSIEGKLLKSINIVDSNISEMDLSDLNGVSYLQFRSISGDLVSKKIVVIK